MLGKISRLLWLPLAVLFLSLGIATRVAAQNGVLPTRAGGTGLSASGANGNCLVSNGTIWTSGSCSGSSSTNFSAIVPDAANTQAGTFTVTGNNWDYSGATTFKFKVGASSTITNAGTSGQVPISNGDGTFTVADPFVSGPVAHDGAGAAVNPLPDGCFANAAAPADVSNDVDITRAWCLRNGSRVVNLAFGGTLVTAGQKTMANSFPIVFASDQSALPVTLTSTTITGTVGVTQSTSPWVVSVPTWAGGTLGAMANYGTSPGAVLVPGVNAFITNIPHVIADSGSTTVVTGTVGVTQSTSPWVGNMTQWASTALGTPTNFGTTPGAVIAGSVNASLFSGTTALGTPNTFGTTAPTGNALGANASLFIGTTVADGNSGNKGAGTQRVVLATDQLALPTWGHGATGAAVPSGATYQGVNSSGNLTGMIICDKYAKDRTSTADVQLIPNSGTTTEYICGIRISGESSTASDVNIRYADSTSCTTNPVDMTPPTTIQVGSTPSGLPGIVEWSPIWGGLKSAATGKEVCVHRSAAQISEIEILYTQF